VKEHQEALSGVTTLSDAFHALTALARRPEIDPKKIGVTGWSRGGTITILAADRKIQDRFSPGGLGFRAGVSIYGSCIQHLAEKTASDMDLLLQLGKQDTWATASQCEMVTQQMRKKGFHLAVHVYDASHGWDVPQPRTVLQNEVAFGSCNMIINDKPPTVFDVVSNRAIRSDQDFVNAVQACGIKGAVVEGKRTVAAESLAEFADYFSQQLLGNKPDGRKKPSPVQHGMTFFVTSFGLGKGGDLGGLAGADAHCQALAASVGAGNLTWRAYLSAEGRGGAIDARDRIGSGPWQNAKGEVIAQNVDDLHGPNNRLSLSTALTERGATVNGVGMAPNNQHDILTGSTADGRVSADMTCNDWTSSGPGAAIVGHHDRLPQTPSSSISWNAAHRSRSCSQQDLIATGGNGLFYCFAAQ
jgi:hypothetical protein